MAGLIRDEGLAKNIMVQWADDTIYYVGYHSAKITFKGLDFLEENSLFAKTYKGLKEVRDWIKL
ncbi:YjcQ family protein [Niallia circulans]|uniref:Uncharacterized protein n=1 Tax=Niallia circulans TaxID=1397 RepID=A0A941JLK5_NIACI|nr:YjcQ family protein [Niallia circulans]MCB5235888.1 YjcQ family protein [Niallia circulans]